jgi:hypothetical protein
MRRRDLRILILLVVIIGFAGGVWGVLHRSTVGTKARFEPRTPNLKEFRALPYVTYVQSDTRPGVKGVTLYDDTLACAGINLLTSMEVGGAHLLDMEGRVLHSWHTCDSIGNAWLYSEVDPDGNLFALVTGVGLVKMDWDSRVLWISKARDNPFLKSSRPGYHHDFEITESGDIYVLAQDLRQVPAWGRSRSWRLHRRDGPAHLTEIRDNIVTTLSPDGIPKRNVSLYDLVGRTMSAEIQAYVQQAEKRSREKGVITVCSDIFHSNTVEEIPGDIAVAERGDILFCIRNLDLVGILGRETGALLWTWGPGILEYPHQPTVLENGNILVFDNGGRERPYSRILELNPGTNEIVWQYEGEPRESFFSTVMGASQRLPNGNTLITDSTSGGVFEVTRDGEIVWEFLNFEVSSKSESMGKRATIYRMIRYRPDYLKRSMRDR